MSPPVLLIGFNRPDLLAQVIDHVRPAEPERVYLAIDGPRTDRPDEVERVHACRDLARALDWGCRVETLFRDVNLGCGRAVSGAISWFFDHEESGLILEDDILVDPTFFGYADAMLTRYRDDPRVFAVTGTNFVPPEQLSGSAGYRFSRVPVVWGWGTWRRAWQSYDFDIGGWRRQLPLRRAWPAMGGTWQSYAVWSANFDLMARHAIDTWDLQLVRAAMTAGAWTVTPDVNLVENAGFRDDATHTHRRPDYLRAVEAMAAVPDPIPVRLDERADAWLMRHVYGASVTGLTGQAWRAVRRYADTAAR